MILFMLFHNIKQKLPVYILKNKSKPLIKYFSTCHLFIRKLPLSKVSSFALEVEISYKCCNEYSNLVLIFLKIPFLPQSEITMENLLPQFQPFKEKIPEFVIKLYHILERQQYSDFITWNTDNQILIKQPKKLEDKVLPHFFRHKHLSSFIRQLNMYKFSKVVKLVKQRNYMYFRNDHFHRGQIHELTKIKRNVKKSKKENLELQQQEQKSDNISIDGMINKNSELVRYKSYVRQNVEQIAAVLRRLEGSYPDIKEELMPSLTKCNQLLEVQEQENHSFMNLSESDLNNGQNARSEKMMKAFEPIMFQSQHYFQ